MLVDTMTLSSPRCAQLAAFHDSESVALWK